MAVNFNKLTIKSQEALQSAQEIASNYSNQMVEPEHIFAALIQDPEGIVSSTLQKLGANKDLMKIKVGELLEKLPKVSGSSSGQSLSRETNEVLENAFKEASALKDEYVSTEHLLLGLSDIKRSSISELLKSQGVTKNNILKALKEVRGSNRVTGQNPEDTY